MCELCRYYGMVKMMTMEEWQAQLVNLWDDLTDEDGEHLSRF